jgi:hypothetical protein
MSERLLIVSAALMLMAALATGSSSVMYNKSIPVPRNTAWPSSSRESPMTDPVVPFRQLAIFAAVVLMGCLPVSAATISKMNDDVLAPLRRTNVSRTIALTKVPLYAHGTASIDLEEFEVWAPGGKVVVHDGKSVQYLDPPPMRFFRGLVNGDPASFAYFSVDGRSGGIYGLVDTRDGKFSVTASRRRAMTRDRSENGDRGEDFDYYLTASDESDTIPMTGQTWECGVDKLQAISPLTKRMLPATDALGHHVVAEGITGTQSYAMTIEVETDDELYFAAGNSVPNVTALATNLTGAVSTIYNRDLKTNVLQQFVHVYSGGPGTDPWVAADAFNGLAEIGNYYHTNHLALKRSAVVMLSGKTTQNGIAWEGTIGEGDEPASINLVSTYSGAYAWCGSIGDFQGPFTTTAPDPNATTNGTLYGMPTVGNNYWPLEEYAHELGHNLAGHHTHCVAITAGEAAGTNHPTQLFIDMCHTGDVEQSAPGGACATGADYSSAPLEKGTIMSYCHNIFSGQVPQSRFTFGQAAEVSHHEIDDYMLRAAGPIGPYGGSFNIVTAVGTFTMSTIGGSSTVSPNSTGNTASVTTTNGGTPTFAWTITNGTITAGATSATVTYTAGASGTVVLRATAYKNGTNGFTFINGGVGITDTKTIIIGGALAAPTNVVATAATTTSVTITWTASVGAVRYHVRRTANNSTYTQVNAESTVGTTFTDTTAAPNTAYFYTVRGYDGISTESADSNKDLATTVIFQDDPVGPTIRFKGVHLTQLQTAVNAVRLLDSGLGGGTYSDTAPSGVTVKRVDIIELRTALDFARNQLGLPDLSLSRTDPNIIQNTTLIKAAHINDLRNAVK